LTYDQALNVLPEDYWCWYQRAEALRRLGRYSEAIISYKNALMSKPEDDFTLYNLACCYAQLGEVNLAMSHLERAAKLNPHQCLVNARADSDFDRIRNQPRFIQLIFD